MAHGGRPRRVRARRQSSSRRASSATICVVSSKAAEAPSSGIGAGFDVVWRPTADEARALWQAQVEMPAPAPTPGDKGRMRDGRIVIDVSSD